MRISSFDLPKKDSHIKSLLTTTASRRVRALRSTKKMNHTSTYEVTPKIQDESMRQFYFTILLRPKIGGMLTILVVNICAIILDPPLKPWVVGALSAICVLIAVTWIKAYFQVMEQARAGLKLMEHPNVEVNFSNEFIEYKSSTGIRKHHWDKIQTHAETKDFVVLMNGKIPLLSLPKSHIPPEVMSFIMESAPIAEKNQKAPRLLVILGAVLGIVFLFALCLFAYIWLAS